MSIKERHDNLVSFSIIVIILGVIFLFQFLLNTVMNEEKIREIYQVANFFKKILPEGEPLYSKAVEYANHAYQVQQYLKQNYDSAVKILIDFLKGSLSFPVWLIFAGAVSYYIIALGILKALTLKSVYLIGAFVVLASAIILFHPQIFKTFIVKVKARIYDPFGDRHIRKALEILLSNQVPASISHHNAFKGGLFQHSLEVATRAADALPEEKQKKGFLAGLLHDIGKIKIYKSVCDEKCSYKSLKIDQELANKIALKEIQSKFKVEIPKDDEVWKVVKKTDIEVAKEELRKANFKVDEELLYEVLNLLNINDYLNTGRPDGFYDGKYLVILASALNRLTSKALLERDPLLPISEEPDTFGVHVIAYSRPYDNYLILEVEGKKADDLGLFDVVVGKQKYSAVYVFDKNKISEQLILKWGTTPYNIHIKERRRT